MLVKKIPVFILAEALLGGCADSADPVACHTTEDCPGNALCKYGDCVDLSSFLECQTDAECTNPAKPK